LKAFAISMGDVLEVNNPDTIYDLVSEGSQVLVFLEPKEPLHLIFPLPENFVEEIFKSPYSHFQDFGDFSVLYLKLGEGRFLSIVAPDIVVIVGAPARLTNEQSIHSSLLHEILDFLKKNQVPEAHTYSEMGRIRRELLQTSRALEDLHRSIMGYLTPQEGYMLIRSAMGLKWKAFELEDKRDEMRIDLLKPVRRFKRIEYLLLGVAAMIFIGFIDQWIVKLIAGGLLLLALFLLIRRSNPVE